MSYQFARIDLSQTNYEPTVTWKFIESREPATLAQLDDIYRTYCIYKHFASVMPIFDSRYLDPSTDVIGYYDGLDLVAFSLIRRYDQENALCDPKGFYSITKRTAEQLLISYCETFNIKYRIVRILCVV